MYLQILPAVLFALQVVHHQITDEISYMVSYTGESQTRRLGFITMSTQ
jgi:hypothetical protein